MEVIKYIFVWITSLQNPTLHNISDPMNLKMCMLLIERAETRGVAYADCLPVKVKDD